jgi:hypothetical protein
VSLDITHNVLDGADLLGVLVGDLDIEFFFQRHHQLDDVERVSAQIFDERRFRLDLVDGNAELLGIVLAIPPGDSSNSRRSIFEVSQSQASPGVKSHGEHKGLTAHRQVLRRRRSNQPTGVILAFRRGNSFSNRFQ